MDPDADGRGVQGWRRGYLADCHRLLALGGFGRLAFTTASRLMVLPVNHALVADTSPP